MSWSLWTFGCDIIMRNKTKKRTHTHTNKSSTTLLKQNQKNGIVSARLIESPKTHAKASNPNPLLQSSSSSSFFTGSSGADEEAPSLLDLSSSASSVHFRHLLHFSGKQEEEEETRTKDRRERKRGAGGGIVWSRVSSSRRETRLSST